MPRFIYEWKNTQHGRRLFRRPATAAKAAVAPTPEPTPEPAAAPEPEPTDFGALTKAELVEAAEERGVDSSGTKADIIGRLEADE